MKKSKYSGSQIVSILKEAEAGRSEKDLPEVRDQLGVLLPVEVEVPRLERLRAAAQP